MLSGFLILLRLVAKLGNLKYNSVYILWGQLMGYGQGSAFTTDPCPYLVKNSPGAIKKLWTKLFNTD